MGHSAAQRSARRIPSREALVAVPYVDGMLWRAVVGACEAQAQRVLSFAIDPDDVGAYARLLVDLWRVPTDLLVVEHDVVPPPHALWNMHKCRHEWCTVPYSVGGGAEGGMLGCSRFALSLRRRRPELARRALLGDPDELKPVPWTLCDVSLSRRLWGDGLRPHRHEPAAVHLHPYNRV